MNTMYIGTLIKAFSKHDRHILLNFYLFFIYRIIFDEELMNMDNNQRQLLQCISAAIHGDKINSFSHKKVNWSKLFKLSYMHNVEGLLYYSLGEIKEANEELFKDIKKNTIITGFQQINHINQLEKVFKEFRDNNIQIAALKGAVVRQLYARPEFRTMSDSDLLIRENDLKEGKAILLNMGYIYIGCEKNHLSFKHKRYLPLDLHWTLEDKREKGSEDFDKAVWENIIEIPIGKAKGLSLCWEDTLVHLLMHMAGHAVNNGFGIRHLCDIVLVIEEKGNEINWQCFYEKIKNNGIEKFTAAVFITCRELFNIEVPDQVIKNKKFTSKYMDIFINYMYSSGNTGRFDLVNVYSNQLAYGPNRRGADNVRVSEGIEVRPNTQSIINRIYRVLFPDINKLKNRFPYAKRFSLLIPLAWLIYIGSYIVKFKAFIISIPLSRKRYRLFKYLEL